MLTGLFALMLLALALPAQAKSETEAKAMLDKAVAVMKSDGKERAFAQFHDQKGAFFDGELYVFVVNFEGKWEAYGPKPSAVGTSLINLKDVDGKEFVKEMIDIAKTKGEGSIEYQWKNPETQKIQPKITFFKRVDDVLVAVGVYK
ncbi:MAG: cache domain-containing protein [Rhodospirillales bacterium]|nr:cache domain-containing protein [Rhodospirillales bacterium]